MPEKIAGAGEPQFSDEAIEAFRAYRQTYDRTDNYDEIFAAGGVHDRLHRALGGKPWQLPIIKPPEEEKDPGDAFHDGAVALWEALTKAADGG